MDSSFVVRPRSALHGPGPRDPVPVRQADTDLNPSRAVNAAGDTTDRERQRQRDQRQDPMPHDAGLDPETRERLFRERDVRSDGGEHPDQALLRQRAYGRPPLTLTAESQTAPDSPQADVQA